MSATLRDGYEPRKLAMPLLAKEHRRLADYRIVWCGTDAKPGKELGICKTYAQSTILSPLHRYLSSGGSDMNEGAHVAIVVNDWLWQRLVVPQRRWLVDHVLEHVAVDEVGTLSLRHHDIGDFSGVIQRHGVPLDPMKAAARAIFELGTELVNGG